MNTKILITIAALCLVQVSSSSIVRREATEATTPKPGDAIIQTFTEVFAAAKAEVEKLEGRFLELVGVENRDQLTQTVANKTNDYVLRLQGLLGDLQAEGQKQAGQVQELVTKTTAQIQESLKKLQLENPEITEQTQKYKEIVTNEFENIVGLTKNLTSTLTTNNAEVTENFNKVVKNIVEQTSATTREIISNVEKSLQEKPATTA